MGSNAMFYWKCIFVCIIWTQPLVIWIIKLWSIVFSVAKSLIAKLFADSQVISVRTSVEIVLNVTVWRFGWHKWWTTFEHLFNLITILVFMKVWTNETTMISVSKIWPLLYIRSKVANIIDSVRSTEYFRLGQNGRKLPVHYNFEFEVFWKREY